MVQYIILYEDTQYMKFDSHHLSSYLSTEVTCTTPVVPHSTAQTGAHKYGDMDVYTCDRGYRFSDGSQAKLFSCGDNGKWTPQNEECSGMKHDLILKICTHFVIVLHGHLILLFNLPLISLRLVREVGGGIYVRRSESHS